jgi:hypothetical protein
MKVVKQRSPNCPQITFQEAAEKGRLIYQKECTLPVARGVIAQSIGYSGINGSSLSMIGALRQYGILQGNGDALRITEDAVSYFTAEDGQEREDVLLRMLFRPPVFAQVRKTFGDSLPGEEELKQFLIEYGFLLKAAADVIGVYRENARFAQEIPLRSTEGESEVQSMSVALVRTRSLPEAAHAGLNGTLLQPTWSQLFTLTKGARAELVITGDVTKEGLARLKTYIELTILALTEDSSAERTNGLS